MYVVPSYKHLGTRCRISSNIAAEVNVRSAIICQETRKLSSKFLMNPKVARAHKSVAVQGYILSKGTYNCGTWPALTASMYRKFHGAIMKLYRQASGDVYGNGDMHDDNHVIQSMSFMCPMTIIRHARNQLLTRVVGRAPSFMKALVTSTVDGTSTWAHTMHNDLTWLASIGPHCEWRGLDLHQWWSIIAEDTKGFSRIVRRLCRSSFANLHVQWATCKSLREIGVRFSCHVCNANFDTRQQCAVHMFRSHSVKSMERCLISTTHCPVCMVEFWTCERAVNHLRYRSDICRRHLLLYAPELSLERADALDAADLQLHQSLQAHGHRRHHAKQQCIRIPGPLLPVILEDDRQSCHHSLGKGRNYCL